MQPADVFGQLRGEGTWTQLGERKSFEVVFLREPSPFINEISLHVPNKSDRSSKSQSAEAKKVQQQGPGGGGLGGLLL